MTDEMKAALRYVGHVIGFDDARVGDRVKMASGGEGEVGLVDDEKVVVVCNARMSGQQYQVAFDRRFFQLNPFHLLRIET